ncbi:iron uptake protein [Luteimonas marina]|uniref:Iron uptake protein n=1 Tax=Luteimonas marina TaxID=488485 RepID=A0A5C5U6A0_9GAMM|nr:iron uptake protein [Luteimonas marina]TWT21309.1 iron uptake protein [Luteimonas marina]
MSQASTTFAPSHRAPRLHLVARVTAAVLGGYAFAWGLIATGASLMFAAGMGFHDAEFLASLLGVLAFLVAFLWAIAARRLWLVWTVLLGGGALLAVTGSLVQSALV